MELFRPEFRRGRCTPIERRLEHIENSTVRENEILDLCDHKYGITNDLVHWKFLQRELLERCLRTIPRLHLAAILRRLSEKPEANRSGFPDLIMFAHGSNHLQPKALVPILRRHEVPFRFLRVAVAAFASEPVNKPHIR